MNLRVVIGWLALAFILWWIIVTPASAAHFVHNVGAFLVGGTRSIADFFSTL